MKLENFDEVKKLVEMKNDIENIDSTTTHFVISNPAYGGARITLNLSGLEEDLATFRHNLRVSLDRRLEDLGVDTGDGDDDTAKNVDEMNDGKYRSVNKSEPVKGPPHKNPDQWELIP